MKKSFALPFLLSVAALGMSSSGCAINDLKNTNRRLKEANDRLVAENNRLEQELAASEKEVADKTKILDDLQKSTPIVKASIEQPKGGLDSKASRSIKGDFPDEPGVSSFTTPQGILVRVEDRVLFPQGRATLAPDGRRLLDKVARTIGSRYRGHLIRVEGHTDDVPVNKVRNQYPSNWELSTARACTVVRYLVDNGSLNPKWIYPAGFAYYKPISSARTPAARSKNRRVEIMILNEQA